MRSRIRRISNSEIQTWNGCKRKWWLAWHRGLRRMREPRVGALWIGSREHEALASVYAPDGRPLVELPEIIADLLANDRELLEEQFGSSPSYPELRKKFDSEAELQKIMLEGYVQWVQETGADDGLEVIAAEEVIEAAYYDSPILNVDVNIIGRLDVRVRRLTDGKIFFIDHKTVSAFIQVGELRRNPQMKMYRTLIGLTAVTSGEHPGGAIYSQLRKVKRSKTATPPFYHRETITFNPIELQTFDQHLTTAVTDIIHAENLLDEGMSHHAVTPPRPSRECSWCPFEKVCDMFDDGSRAEDYLVDHFVNDNPLHYYDTEGLTRHDTTDALPAASA